ncbi:MAG: hypothetical protein ACOVVK_01990 [Elsteraceae bacterium]
MTPLVTPALIKPAAPPRPPSSGEGSRSENARFVVVAEGEAQPSPAALAALAMMGGKPAVASRMEARRIARKQREEKEKLEEEAEQAAAAVDEAPPVVPPIEKPRINVEAELAAVRSARRPPRGVGPLTAFLAQQFGQSGSLASSFSAPLKWLIAAYVRHHIPETPPPKRQTLTVS